MSRTLFVTWDGPSQNYMEALFFPTFSEAMRASKGELKIGALQFSWAEREEVARIARCALDHHLSYEHVPVVRRHVQLATPAMIAYGAWRIVRESDAQGWDTLMPRSIIPAAMCLLALKARPHLKLVYDADGFMADERVDFSGWAPTGAMYRLFRDWEAQAVRRASKVMTRSSHAKRILIARAGAAVDEDKIAVIPNGKDAAQFTPLSREERAAVRAELDVPPDAPLLVYAGSLGPQYHPRAMIELFAAIKRRSPEARLLVLSRMSEVIEQMLPMFDEQVRAGVMLRECAASEVPRLLGAADLGLSLREPSFSQQGVCPIKVAEYMLCGLPVVMLRGVGDLDERFASLRALKLLSDVGDESLEQAARWFVEEASAQREQYREASRRAGVEEFALERVAAALSQLVLSAHSEGEQR